MTKHLLIAVILRHMAMLNLAHVGGRSEAAAKLHILVAKAAPRKVVFVDPKPKRAVNDYWAERGEHGRWVRVHTEPRLAHFDPWRAPRGPGRRTKLKDDRITQGTYIEGGGNFQKKDNWQSVNETEAVKKKLWTGRTIFMVDKRYSREFGTDQRRQRTTVANHSDELV